MRTVFANVLVSPIMTTAMRGACNPLADITNTTTIRAVVANGRYYDRATLDRLLAEVRARGRQGGRPWNTVTKS